MLNFKARLADKNLNAKLNFQYEENELNGLDESNLILYSSIDNGKTWDAHPNSIVDPITNTITLDHVEHFSLLYLLLPIEATALMSRLMYLLFVQEVVM